MTRRDRVALIVIVAIAFALRVWWAGAFAPNPSWSDPDGYTDMSRVLVGAHGWRWTFAAVRFAEFTKAPLYQVLLSLLWRAGGTVPFVPSALVLHAALNALTCVALYITGRYVHRPRAGLLAAAVYAVWATNILPTATFWQEQLFIPAVCWGMACAAWAGETRAERRWLLAGCVFGIAALTRSSITYFVVPAAALVALSGTPRRASLREGAMLIAGFALLVLPYVLYVSSRTGRITFIESIGYFSLKRFIPVSPVDPSINLLTIMHDPAGPPTTGEVLRFLSRDFAASPGAFVLRRLDFLRLLVKPGGAAFIASHFAPTHTAARLLTVAVHLLLDLPFVLALVLAPFGAVLARQRRAGLFVALWPPIYLGLVALMLWAGTRYRAPAEPVLLTLACVVASGGWRRPGRGALACATACCAGIIVLVGISAPSLVSLRMNYGVSAAPEPGRDVAFNGEMGAYFAATQMLTITLRNDATTPVPIDVRMDGKPADAFLLGGETTRRYKLEAPRRVFLEVRGPGRMTVRLE